MYKINPISEGNMNEDDIVKKLLGDSAVKLDGSGERKYLTIDDKDSTEIIYTGLWILYHNNVKVNYASRSLPINNDEPTVSLNIYEGTRNNIPYQLLISYSKNYNELIIACHPKNIGDIVGNSELDYQMYNYPDGNIYYYDKTLQTYAIDDIMGDRPNQCTLSKEDINANITTLLNDLDLSFPETAIDHYYNEDNVSIPEGEEPKRLETIFCNENILASSNLEGAVRDGYVVAALGSINGIKIMQDTEKIDSEADQLSTGQIYVNNSGVYGFSIASKYTFEETITENSTLLNFDEAMEAFAKEVPENLTPDNLDRVKNQKIDFDIISLEYYPVKTEDEYILTPVWSLEAQNSNYQTIARVIISAVDGKYITTIYEDKEE